MKKIAEMMKNISEATQIPFRMKDELGDIYVSPSFITIKEEIIERIIEVENRKIYIQIPKSEEKVIILLEYYIENILKESYIKKRMVINEILSNNFIQKEEVIEAYPCLASKFNMILIYVDNMLEEALELLKECYDESNMPILIYQDKILILGQLESVYEHAISIKETIITNISAKVIISYCKVESYKSIIKHIEECNEKINVVRKFGMDIDIVSEKDTIFEEIVDNINIKKKEELMDHFNKRFKKLDNDMMKTIDVFFKCGLNLSEAAKELYIHRNTLIYRIDKIEKITGFDIRVFNQAAIFKVVYTLWKGENKF